MTSPEYSPEMMESLDTSYLEDQMGFDVNAAFIGALSDVIDDKEILLNEKIRKMETIISQGTSSVYSEFIDFRQMTAQIQMMCSRDHNLTTGFGNNSFLSGFMDSHVDQNEHSHHSEPHYKRDDEDEIDPKTGKKKKRRRN